MKHLIKRFYQKYKTNKDLVLISGLCGTGKTSMYQFFLENPVKGFIFFDYDNGKHKIPIITTKKNWHKVLQYNWWINVARKTIEKNKLTPVIFGVCPSPSAIKQQTNEEYFSFEDHYFILLTCRPDEREKRLIQRGSQELFFEHLPWHDIYLEDYRKFISLEVDTSNKTLEDTGSKIRSFLTTLR